MAPASAVLRGALAVAAVRAEPWRLRIVNGCHEAPIWIAHEAGPTSGPGEQNARIDPGQHRDFPTADGVSATRYWPKMGCDDHGDHCMLGGSGGPGQACVIRNPGGDDYSHCAPPIDTKFEATFGWQGRPCSDTAQEGCDFIDMSLVDGYTLPFKLEMQGPWCSRANRVLDCSGLTFARCPSAEGFSAGFTKDLRAINPVAKAVAGCYSPCSKLTMEKWGNPVLPREDGRVAPYCCPIPPSTPESCRAGPVKDTQFVGRVHSVCPGVYGYSFDDAEGLMKCHPSTHYTLTFYCPAQGSRSGGRTLEFQPHTPSPAAPRAVAAACRTESELCAEFVPGRACQCHPGCAQDGSCCVDFGAVCRRGAPPPPEVPAGLERGLAFQPPTPPPAAPGAAAAACRTEGELCAEFVPGRACQCHPGCAQDGSCCHDFGAVCRRGGPPPPEACRQGGNDCAERVPGRRCQCGPQCESEGSCCPDYTAMCVPPVLQKDELPAGVGTAPGSQRTWMQGGLALCVGTAALGAATAALRAQGGGTVGPDDAGESFLSAGPACRYSQGGSRELGLF